MAAGGATVGALQVIIGADTASLEAGLKRAGANLAAFGASAATAGAVLGAAMVAMGAAIGMGIKHAIDEADKLGKMAQKVGIPVEELSKLKHAADLSGVSLESLGTSMGKLSKTMVEAAAKPTSEAALAFKALGVSVLDSDGKMKSSSRVISDVAGKFETLKDGAGKTAVSMAIFGKSGKDMIPLLNSGKDGLQDMKGEAEKLGIVISSKTAKSAEAFNDNLTRLGKVKDGIILKITEHMLPGLQNLSTALVNTANNGSLMKAAGEAIGAAFEQVISVGLRAILVFKSVATEWAAMREWTKQVPFTAESQKAWDDWGKIADENKRQIAALSMTLQTANLADAFGPIATVLPPATKSLKDFNFQALAGKNAIDQFLDSQTKRIASLQAEVAAFGQSIGTKERLLVIEQALAVQATSKIAMDETQRAKMVELGFAAELYAQKLMGIQLIQQNREPVEQYRIDLENARLAMTALGKSTEEVGAVQAKIAEKYGATWHQASESVAGSIATIGQAFGKENKAMAMTAKIAGAIQATISMFVGAAKALELPWPANIAAMVAVLAKGAALVASIKGTSVGGFATGGSFTVPGSGGIDSQRLNLDVSPGERVDIWRPGEGGDDPRRGAGGGETVIRVITDDIARPIIEKFIAGFNEAFADGHTLKLA